VLIGAALTNLAPERSCRRRRAVPARFGESGSLQEVLSTALAKIVEKASS
jgi:hypothetical protein